MHLLVPAITATRPATRCWSPVARCLAFAVMLSIAPWASGSAQTHRLCPELDPRPDRRGAGLCYAGVPCVVGVRGEGLEGLVAASAVSGNRAVVRGGAVLAVGDGRATAVGACLPDGTGSFASIRLPAMEEVGPYTLVLQRSALFGMATSETQLAFQLVASHGFLNPRQAEASERARVGQPQTFSLAGRNLGALRLRASAALQGVEAPASTDVQWMSPDQSQVRIRLTFAKAGTISLRDVFEFIGSGESPVNRDLGWPVVHVMR